MSMKMLAGAAAVVALIATPAMATPQKSQSPQLKSSHSQTTAARKTGKMKMQNRLDSRASMEQRGTGFAPLDVAGNVVGGAVSTAGAIATAPFRPFTGDSYAWARDPSTGRGTIADDNGPRCLPGTVTTVNGQQMRCQ